MARSLRIEYPGAFYHVASRGNERKNVFLSAKDREQFLAYLESATAPYEIHVYCLMSNHYHLLVETPRGNLSAIMRHINSAYTTYFNVKRRRSGHLFQGRYKAILVSKDEYGKQLSRYIHLNPVRAGIAGSPGEYPWSSYRAYSETGASPSWLYREFILALFGPDSETAMKAYRDFVEGAMGLECANPFEQVRASTLLGSESFVKWARETFLKGVAPDRELPALRQLSIQPALETIRAAAEAQFKNDPAMSRRIGMYLCRLLTGRKLKEIGAIYGVGESAITQASRRVEEEMKRNGLARKSVEALAKGLRVSRV